MSNIKDRINGLKEGTAIVITICESQLTVTIVLVKENGILKAYDLSQ